MAQFAAMAELADALDSGSSRGNSVDVRVILAARNAPNNLKSWKEYIWPGFYEHCDHRERSDRRP